jgi:hypothetical protein
MKQKIALYEIRTNEDRWQYLKEATEYHENEKSYIRVSNIVEVEFEMIDDSLIIPKKVEALRAEKAAKAAEYDEKIGKLLAITHQPDGEEEGS